MNESEISAYLARIGVDRSGDLSPRALQHAHLTTVPFENLSIHLDEPIVLTPEALFDKVVNQRRGGFCYELNGLFAGLLTALGHRVTLLAARVYGGDRLGPLFDHLALRVELDEPWLVDVGFGDFADAPLRLGERGEQADGAGVFEIRPADHGDLDVLHNGRPAYRLTERAYELADFVPTAWWQSTSPDSHFTRSAVCSMRTPEGRITLSGDKLITTSYGERAEKVLAEAELLPAYREHFGVELGRLPVVR